jgi:cell division protein FtsL
MTPTALTPAARETRPKARSGSAAGRGTQPKPRSGPAAGRETRPKPRSGPAAGRGTGHRAPVRRSPTPHAPRRVSGPARPARTRPSERPALRPSPAARSAAFLRALPDHALLDRIIRGRYWIPLLGVLLVGIVAMQVEVLKLNAGIGRALEQTTSLQSRNEQLRAAVAREGDDQRIESMAAHMGMVMPQPAAIRFLQRHPIADVDRAVANIHAPDATAFQAALTAAGIPTTASGAAGTGSTAATTGTSAASTGASATAATGSTSTGVVTTSAATGSTSPGT